MEFEIGDSVRVNHEYLLSYRVGTIILYTPLDDEYLIEFSGGDQEWIYSYLVMPR